MTDIERLKAACATLTDVVSALPRDHPATHSLMLATDRIVDAIDELESNNDSIGQLGDWDDFA